MLSVRTKVLPLGLSLALLGIAFHGASYTVAQDATPAAEAEAEAGRPAHIHAGACAEGELGDIVAPLTNLTAPEGDGAGQDAAVPAESSFTSVPLPLDAILAEDHAVNVHLSTEEIGTYLACGEIGGVLGTDGSLVIGLKEYEGSGFSGIAFLSLGGDGASTNVSVFIADGLGGGAVGGADDGAVDDATPVAAGSGADAAALTIEAADFAFEPETLSVSADTETELTLTNTGEAEHNLTIEELDVDVDIEPGESTTVPLNAAAGSYDFFCEYHQRRMTGTLEVE